MHPVCAGLAGCASKARSWPAYDASPAADLQCAFPSCPLFPSFPEATPVVTSDVTQPITCRGLGTPLPLLLLRSSQPLLLLPLLLLLLSPPAGLHHRPHLHLQPATRPAAPGAARLRGPTVRGLQPDPRPGGGCASRQHRQRRRPRRRLRGAGSQGGEWRRRARKHPCRPLLRCAGASTGPVGLPGARQPAAPAGPYGAYVVRRAGAAARVRRGSGGAGVALPRRRAAGFGAGPGSVRQPAGAGRPRGAAGGAGGGDCAGGGGGAVGGGVGGGGGAGGMAADRCPGRGGATCCAGRGRRFWRRRRRWGGANAGAPTRAGGSATGGAACRGAVRFAVAAPTGQSHKGGVVATPAHSAKFPVCAFVPARDGNTNARSVSCPLPPHRPIWALHSTQYSAARPCWQTRSSRRRSQRC